MKDDKVYVRHILDSIAKIKGGYRIGFDPQIVLNVFATAHDYSD